MTTTTQHAIDLMPQLRDILGLPKDFDLPRLANVQFTAHEGAPGWLVQAQLRTMSDEHSWDALLAWGSGKEPTLGEVHKASYMRSGTYRKATVTVVIAEVSVTIWAHVDGKFKPPKPEPVRVTGAFADFLLGEDVTA